ncbi:GntR family transcriptional regulator [Pseudonocardia acaciae]|uniref:GntR family transcriptional regulator n=1 Tax=Pseudonocardia acaciae TaxID=551276 RepID=UPI000A8C29B7|nr:GntR family transcriptional regulator [Pseudonocardia acaciae]
MSKAAPSRPAGQGLTRPERAPGQGIADWVFESIKADVLSGRVAAEEILVEGALAERFGVSRGPAREALQRLRRTGLVRSVPRVGYIVAGVGLRDYDEVFQIRIALEPLAAELATDRIARGLADPARLLELAGSTLPFATDPSPDRGQRHADLNHDFHHEIAALSGNGRLAAAIDSVHDELQRVLTLVTYDLSTLGEMTDDHVAIARAVTAGDPAAARELMRDQLTRAYTLMRDYAVTDGGMAPYRG